MCSKWWTPNLPPRVGFPLQVVQDRVVTPSMGHVGDYQRAPALLLGLLRSQLKYR